MSEAEDACDRDIFSNWQLSFVKMLEKVTWWMVKMTEFVVVDSHYDHTCHVHSSFFLGFLQLYMSVDTVLEVVNQLDHIAKESKSDFKRVIYHFGTFLVFLNN